jgi:hypothetical protein
MAEGFLERVVQRGGTNVEEGLHARPVPAHLLFLAHTLGHDLVDGLTALSTNPVEIGSSRRRRAA